jgi:hypothetical protein
MNSMSRRYIPLWLARRLPARDQLPTWKTTMSGVGLATRIRHWAVHRLRRAANSIGLDIRRVPKGGEPDPAVVSVDVLFDELVPCASDLPPQRRDLTPVAIEFDSFLKSSSNADSDSTLSRVYGIDSIYMPQTQTPASNGDVLHLIRCAPT